MKTRDTFVAIFLSLVALVFTVRAQTLNIRAIMAEPSIAGMRAEGEKLSPDGRFLAFFWNAEGRMPRDLYIASTSDGALTKLLSPADLPLNERPQRNDIKLDYGLETRDEFVRSRENQIGNVEWAPDSKRLIFTFGGDIFILTIGDSKPKRLTNTQTPEFGARFLDNERILFSQSGNAYILNTTTAELTQITREANQQNFISVGSVTPNKAGLLIAYTVTDASKQRPLIVPNYLPEFVAANTVRRGWTEQKLMVTSADGRRGSPHEIKLPKPEGVSSFRSVKWAADGRSLLVDMLDRDTKRRRLFYVFNVGGKSEKIITIDDDTDPKWQASLSAIVEPHPSDPLTVLFCSEKDGYNHIYLARLTNGTEDGLTPKSLDPDGLSVPSDAVKVTQLTQGKWQVEWAKWTVDGKILFSSTEKNTAEREFYIIDPQTGDKLLYPTGDAAFKGSPQLSDSGEKQILIFDSSKWNVPQDFFAVTVCSGCETSARPVRLTNTVPEQFLRIRWNAPRFIQIPSRDGKSVPAKIYLPQNFDSRSKTKYPMAIFVHGAGYLQNVINGWNNYYREFMFNQLLTQKGYVVLDIDYRGSAGYGRDWRTDVYDFLGGKDFDDHIDSIDFMVKNYAVDQNRIGVYGGSYGGFMAGMLVLRAPERIAAAAALRPVFDWKNYFAVNPFYTAQRLGFPDKNPEAYRRSSPIAYADRLERPLLILHGMSDDNVHFQDSVQMIEKLIRLGKTPYFETMFYPSENHGFVRPESWADEYERILALFEKHLK